VMFFFSRDDFTSRVTSPVMCPVQRIGIWRFEAAIRTIIIISLLSTLHVHMVDNTDIARIAIS